MLTIEPTGAVLGATARGVDLARPLSERSLGQILLALGRYGVLRFPDQHLDLGELKHFSEHRIVAPFVLVGSSSDSPLEGAGFELSVPREIASF